MLAIFLSLIEGGDFMIQETEASHKPRTRKSPN
jgi:hypothetical protein